ncbi:MAG TPA: uracil-DNA glycosylase [Pyrinomonadaceae bacterium]|nr:uracil-DNA glycosylase [Pyrinomonadaceae bacterium]
MSQKIRNLNELISALEYFAELGVDSAEINVSELAKVFSDLNASDGKPKPAIKSQNPGFADSVFADINPQSHVSGNHGRVVSVTNFLLAKESIEISDLKNAADSEISNAKQPDASAVPDAALRADDLKFPVNEKKTRRGIRIEDLPKLKGRIKDRKTSLQESLQSLHSKTSEETGLFKKETLLSAEPAASNNLFLSVNDDDSIEKVREDIGDCTRCKLHSLGRKQIVHTTGNFRAELMFIGEAPGADEDEQGFPFVGRAGQLLTKIIESIGLKREEVCIGNINRCRPPGNRAPEPDEAAACRPFILREIAIVKPKVIVVLGTHAAHNLLGVKTPISKLRGHFHDLGGVSVMPTFHPAYLLRDPNKKREVWEDMKMVRDYLRKNNPK